MGLYTRGVIHQALQYRGLTVHPCWLGDSVSEVAVTPEVKVPADVQHSPGPAGDFKEKEHRKSGEFRFSADPSGGGELIMVEQKGHLDCHVVYSREFLMQCAESPCSWISPPSMAYVSMEMPEILRNIPGRFRAKDYKNACSQLKKTFWVFRVCSMYFFFLLHGCDDSYIDT